MHEAFDRGFSAEFAKERQELIQKDIDTLKIQLAELSNGNSLEDYLSRLPEIVNKLTNLLIVCFLMRIIGSGGEI